MGEFIANLIRGLFELIGTIIVEITKDSARKKGYTEIEIKKLERRISWTLVFVFIAFLFWLTLKYS